MLNLLPVNIWIEAVTGERWQERIRLFQTVAELKNCIWKRKRIPPTRQALVHCGRALSDTIELDVVGIRENSVLKLVVMTRTGPNGTEDMIPLSDEPSDREHNRRKHFEGISAPEDTSAKESSAGETEKEGDEEVGLRLVRVAETNSTGRHPRRLRTNSRGQYNANRGDDSDGDESSAQCSEMLGLNDRIVLEKDNAKDESEKEDNMEDLSMSENGISEEGSEVSSGIIVCDLTNEFRKLKVRRHRHPPIVNSNKQRNRSRTREAHDVSSSEDNDASVELASISSVQLPARRNFSKPVRGINMRGTTSRCSICAFKLTNGFYCRCGKTLCSRHKSGQSHTCSKTRTKLQQVSD